MKRARGMKWAMTLATRVVCDEERDSFGGKSDGNEGDRRLMAKRAMATAMTWVMVMVTMLVGDEEGKGESKGDGDSDEGGGQRRGNCDGSKSDGDGDNGGGQAMAMPTKRVIVIVMVTRVGEGGGQ